MATDFKTPIKCPNCHKLLTIVQMEVTKVLEWTINEEDEERQGRFEDNGQYVTEVFCYNCNKKIGYYDQNTEWGLFPDSTVTDF